MSDLEEPPAKVLKIDNIDGVTHVTELTGFTEPFDPSVPGEAMLGEESGIIEGGADPEQEEWLSEGILTDDDFNASQGTVDDQTDSQLGTEDEEHLDSTLDSEANLGTNDAQIDDTENQAQLHESEEHLTETEANDNEAQLTSEPQTAETETHLTESETHLNETDAHLPETGEHLDENEASFAQNELSFEIETHLNGNNVNGAHSMTGLVENGAYVLETNANVDTSEMNAESEPSLIQIEINVNPKNTTINSTVNDSNMTINDTNVANETNATDDTDVTNVTSDTNVTNDTIMAQSIEHLMAMANIDAAMMESQTYTQDLLESDTKESDIVIQRVITVNKNPNVKEIETKAVALNIEETMKHLDGEKDGGKAEEDFEQLLEKSTVEKINKVKTEPKDDGNDTDDLLRMLGEDDSKGKKKLTKTVRDIRAAAGDAASTDDDDDDFVYEGTSAKMKNLKHLKAAKNALAKRQPAKAEPEEMDDDDDDTEMSADESKTMQRIFNTTSNSLQQRRTAKAPVAVKRTPAVVNVIERPRGVKPPTRTYQNKRLLQSGASLLKPTIQTRSQPSKPSYSAVERKPPTKSDVKTPVPFKPSIQIAERKKEKIEPPKIKTEPGKIEPSKIKIEPGKTKTEIRRVRFDPASVKVEPARGKVGSRFEPEMKGEPDEMIDEEEFLDDEEFGLDEDEFAESEIDMSHHRQRIMRPEMMDEEVPSDGESVSEDGSLYDELPSSDSEDVDDWFTLDIRSEKAADYIPLLGPKAKELLLEEKRRVAARLSTLKQSHTALISTGKQQAATLRRATATLAELDDMLRAA